MLVITRSDAAPVLHWIIVAPVTRSARPIATHLPLGPEEGLAVACAAAFDDLQPMRRTYLTARAGSLDPTPRLELCDALRALADC